MKKIILIVLDGASDRGENTPLHSAEKPAIDALARNGRCGLIDIGYRKHVESDIGFLTLLGFFTKENYPGRGYLEAIGIGLKPKGKELCIRGNFATLDKNGNVSDRRGGREDTGLDFLCEQLDGMEIDGVRFHVRAGLGHRVVIMLEGGHLSKDIIPNDPLLEGKPLPQVGAATPSGKFTASVINKFLYRSRKIIESSGINSKRKTPVNAIIIRNDGMKKKHLNFEETYGMSGCCIAGVPIAKGIARYLGMQVVDVHGATGNPDTNLKAKAEKTIESLKKHDFVWLHINGSDILAHDAKRKEKTRFIERIDSEVISKIVKSADMEKTAIIITCDHGTDSEPSFKHYRHIPDPVPVLVSGNGVKPGNTAAFDEDSCRFATMRIKGNGLIPFVMRISSD
jgi:2,3-bisphosphoglycerate-independent phosphoglycerate mutase